MADSAQGNVVGRLMKGIGFTAEELELNRKGAISPRQLERIGRQVRALQTGGQGGKLPVGALIGGAIVIAVLISVPQVIQNTDISAFFQGPWLVTAALAIGGMTLVAVAGGLWNQTRWTGLRAELAAERFRVKTATSRVTPVKDDSDSEKYYSLLPEVVRLKRGPWKYFARISNITVVLDHDPAATYVSGATYRLYYVGSKYAPLVLSAEAQ